MIILGSVIHCALIRRVSYPASLTHLPSSLRADCPKLSATRATSKVHFDLHTIKAFPDRKVYLRLVLVSGAKRVPT